MRRLLVVIAVALPLSAQAQTWRFAVSGDSRNCGDVVMPAMARGVKTDGAAFYWHLGDFRALHKIDEDMEREAKTPYTITNYFSAAWPDFIRNQIGPLYSYSGVSRHRQSRNDSANARRLRRAVCRLAEPRRDPATASHRQSE
jgi:hypothetical protein